MLNNRDSTTAVTKGFCPEKGQAFWDNAGGTDSREPQEDQTSVEDEQKEP